MDSEAAEPTAAVEARRSSIEKTPIPFQSDAVERLPDEIIEQILQASDPNGFASLVVLNRKWRHVSQRPHLYLHHLSRCSSHTAANASLPTADDENLPRLRQLFAREVKRNLFDAYLRPNETVIKLVSNSISSSSCPGGEGMQFGASPRGHHMLAYNSSRIYVIDVRGPSLEVKRELRILRRPASVCITDDATQLAVLSTEMQVDLYDLQQSPPKRKQSMILDNSPRTIAMSSCGTVLAAAYEGGIEVSSLNPGALATDRRAVKCDAVDALAFSFDGTQILGTTIQSASPSTVILTAPYYDPSNHSLDENLSAMWTTSILFPNSSHDCSHAVLLQNGSHEEAAWAFAYDRSFETFRAVRMDDLRNGTTYFTGPVPKTTSQAKLLPCTLPATTFYGDLVSAGFQGNEVWVYGVPEDLDAVPEAVPHSTLDGNVASPGLGRRNSAQSSSSRQASTRAQDAAAAGGRVPQWQILCDKLRNNFVAGHKISELTGVSNVKWVSGFGEGPCQERLVVAARGISAPKLITEEEDVDFVDGGRITLLDFDYGLANGTRTEITIEVGTDDAEVLEEEQRDMETEVAIVRRRTVAQRRGGGSHALMRAATSAAQNLAVPPPARTQDAGDDPLAPRNIGRNPAQRQPSDDLPEESDDPTIEEQEAMDAPYAHASPRSGMTLRRAATAAAVNRRLNPRTADGRPIEYRRADGRAEHPHESDADNWVPPPPPYQPDDPGDMPAFLRGQAISVPPMVVTQPPPQVPPMPIVYHDSKGVSAGTGAPIVQRTQENVNHSHHPLHQHRTVSDSVTVDRTQFEDIPRPQSSPPVPADIDTNIYDASPPGSPRPALQQADDAELSGTDSRPVSAMSNTSGYPFDLSEPIQPIVPATVGESFDIHDDRNVAFGGVPRSASWAPSSLFHNTEPVDEEAVPQIRRLSNSQTWPLAPQPELSHIVPITDETAQVIPSIEPPRTRNNDASLPGFVPAPSSDQLARLNKRISQGNPRRLSGGLAHHRQSRSRSSGTWTNMVQPIPVIAETSSAPYEIDQPLIISTPKGVSGAYDPPSRRTSTRNDTPILAPIPQRPRPGHGSSNRPTVERLETIYSIKSIPETAAVPPAPPASYLLPAWLRGPNVSPGKSTSSINRRPSRAERSAAKNMKDARKRGWKAKNKKKSKKSAETRTESSTGWTDISPVVAPKLSEKDKKCVVM